MDAIKINTLRLKLGAMCGIPPQTCLISKKNRDVLGLALDELVLIDHEGLGQVTRFILKSPNIPEKDDFVFVSVEDLKFLSAEIAEAVDVTPDKGGIACP